MHRTRVVADELAPEDAVPGSFVAGGKRVLVATGGRGLVELLSVQLPGKRAVDARSFANGVQPKPGELLGG